jgi:hypothetical protein
MFVQPWALAPETSGLKSPVRAACLSDLKVRPPKLQFEFCRDNIFQIRTLPEAKVRPANGAARDTIEEEDHAAAVNSLALAHA